jgi:hypothetical protein
MATHHRLTTERQALRAFRQLVAACDMRGETYIRALRRIGDLAEEFADDELIVQRIYAIQAMSEGRHRSS